MSRAENQSDKFVKAVNLLLEKRLARNKREIVAALNWDETAMSNVINGRRTVPEAIYEKLFKVYKLDNNGQPAATGEAGYGFAVNESPGRYEAVPLNPGDMKLMYVPLVNQYAYAGYLRGYSDASYIGSLPKMPWVVDREYKGDYFAFEVRGDSMDNGTSESYKEGDLLLCREISRNLWVNSKLHIKKWDFVIVHKTEGILIKRITAHDVARGIITIHSINELYPDASLKLKDIAQIFNVVKSLRNR